MPRTNRPKPLYQRGPYQLYRRADRNALQIIWYDPGRRRERSISTGTSSVAEAWLAVDRLYLGDRCCPTCQRPWEQATEPGGDFVTAAIADYVVLTEAKASAEAIGHRLSHVLRYVEATDPAVRCAAIDEAWINKFRKWMIGVPIISQTGATRERSLATVESSVVQLAAAITATQSFRAKFKARKLHSLNRIMEYRADVTTLAAMFRYALADPSRENLLRYLRAAVATWARPDAVMDISTDPKRQQWLSSARVLRLNPLGRQQTKKFRATVPIARQFAPHLDSAVGNYITVASIKRAWGKMAAELNLPANGEAGTKLIRRSMATLARRALGEESWVQGEIMLGHRKPATSDIYAILDPANLGKVLAVTEAIIDEIEALAPGSYRTHTADGKVVAHVRKVRNA